MLNSKRIPILPPPKKQKYQIHLHTENCDGCSVCVQYCTPKALEIGPFTNSRMLHHVIVSNLDDCDGCGQCERVCPSVSIYITEIDDMEENRSEYS